MIPHRPPLILNAWRIIWVAILLALIVSYVFQR